MKNRAVLRPRLLSWLVALAGLTLVVPGCSEHQDPMQPSDNGDVMEIELRNFEFVPSDVTITPGKTVRWRNTTATFHTVTPDSHTEWQEWQTAAMGETFEVKFDHAGTFQYYCVPHQALGMTGRIVVQ